jgi:hypothetical protein
MPRPLAALSIGAIALIAGCGSSTISTEPVRVETRDASPNDRIRVMLPPPSDPGGEAAGRIVSARVIEVLQQTHGDVALVSTADEHDGLAASRQANATFLIVPTILEWTDAHSPPLTADRVKVRLELQNPVDGVAISAIRFENSSSLFAVVDTRPEALLDSSFDRAVNMLVATGSPGHGTLHQPGPNALEHVPVDEQKFPRQ